MPDPDISTETLALLGRIAGAIREELGEAIDAYPGCRSPEGADPINRAFRAIVVRLLEAEVPPMADPDGSISRALRLLAGGRLVAEGWDDDQFKSLIEGEPGGPDDWLAFLILSSRPQIEPLLDPDHA
jgi:hypothetical protein